jgi:hypothetical protein
MMEHLNNDVLLSIASHGDLASLVALSKVSVELHRALVRAANSAAESKLALLDRQLLDFVTRSSDGFPIELVRSIFNPKALDYCICRFGFMVNTELLVRVLFGDMAAMRILDYKTPSLLQLTHSIEITAPIANDIPKIGERVLIIYDGVHTTLYRLCKHQQMWESALAAIPRLRDRTRT